MLKLTYRNDIIYITGTFLNKRVRKSTDLPRGMEDAAKKMLASTMATIASGGSVASPAASGTFMSAHNSYIKHKIDLASKSVWCSDICLQKWGTRKLDTITEPEIKEWIATELMPRGQWLARRVATQMSAIMKHAVAMGMLHASPSIKRPKEPKVVPFALSKDQRDQLLLAIHANTPEIYAPFLFMAHTGARPIEMARLETKDVMGGQVILRHRKGGGQWTERLVPLNPMALAAIAMGSKSGQIFMNGSEPWNISHETVANRLGMRFAVARKAAGMDDRVTPYTMRHTFATLLLQGGVDIRTVQALMGHSTIEQTARYLSLVDALKKDGVTKLL